MREVRHPTPAIVFVVDDDVSVRESLELLIRSGGWQPETFASAQDFLARPRVDVRAAWCSTCRFPDLNGLDLQKRSRDRTDMPIIFITGYGDVPMTRPGDEGRRGRVPDQAVRGRRAARRDPAAPSSAAARRCASERNCTSCATVTRRSRRASARSWRWSSPAC